MTTGQRIYSRRKELNMTMEELGAKCGVDRSTVNKWEKDVTTNLKRSTIQILANALKCSPVWLMCLTDEVNFSPALSGARDGELLNKFHKLTPQNKIIIESTIDAMLKNQ